MNIASILVGWRGIAVAGALGLVVGLGCGFGGCWWLRDAMAAKAERDRAQDQAEAAKAVAAGVQASASITQSVGQAVETRRDQVRVEYRTIIEKVPVYVTAEADRQCVVPVGFVRLHDAAAGGSSAALPDGPGEPADAPSGVPLSAVGETVAWNYGQCADDRERLKGWQDWYERQRAEWEERFEGP